MNKSMTGYGTASFESETMTVSVEVKTLNSKFLDINLRLPRVFSDKEIEVRNLLSDRLQRGKAAVNIEYQRLDAAATKLAINKKLFLQYYQELSELAGQVGANTDELLKLTLQSPEVMVTEKTDEDLSEDWQVVLDTLKKALEHCNAFREQEGQALVNKLAVYADTIEELLAEVEKQEPTRLEVVKTRIKQSLEELKSPEKIDENRFEQELIYYIEKLDINEEKVRLRNHLKYFHEIMKSKESQGKKLGFVAQEIGREINTIGSKANDAVIQKLVVSMKEELEKIKEQVLNVV
jgi:uncharacterized protein (TIGR00255 family)